MTAPPSIGLALVESLDDSALDCLAQRLASRLAGRVRDLGGDSWLTAREAASHLGMTVPAIHKLTAARDIPFEQDGPGCKLWFQRSELDRWRRGDATGLQRAASTPLPEPREAAS